MPGRNYIIGHVFASNYNSFVFTYRVSNPLALYHLRPYPLRKRLITLEVWWYGRGAISPLGLELGGELPDGNRGELTPLRTRLYP